MARTRRIKFTDRDALHHVTSRVSGRQMLLAGAGVKDDMLGALERAAEFSGVNVGAFALLDNHFHIVVQVPFHAGTVPEVKTTLNNKAPISCVIKDSLMTDLTRFTPPLILVKL